MFKDKKLIPSPPLPKSAPTPLDYVPGYCKWKYQQYRKPGYTKITKLKAVAVIVQKTK